MKVVNPFEVCEKAKLLGLGLKKKIWLYAFNYLILIISIYGTELRLNSYYRC